jgi:hypothetical protein
VGKLQSDGLRQGQTLLNKAGKSQRPRKFRRKKVSNIFALLLRKYWFHAKKSKNTSVALRDWKHNGIFNSVVDSIKFYNLRHSRILLRQNNSNENCFIVLLDPKIKVIHSKQEKSQFFKGKFQSRVIWILWWIDFLRWFLKSFHRKFYTTNDLGLIYLGLIAISEI